MQTLSSQFNITSLKHTRATRNRQREALRVCAAKERSESITGIVFKPFDEVQGQLTDTDKRGGLNDPNHSFVRLHYDNQAEAAINEQINVEYNISYVYHAMSAYFDRDNVSLPGLAKYFYRQSDEERGHAQMFMNFQNTRGGRVHLNALVPTVSEYNHAEKGDALYAMELALSLERLNYEKLLALHKVMEKHGDAQAVHFVENILEEQVEDIKETADYVAQLRRIGKGHGVWHFDHEMYESEIRYMAKARGPHGDNGAA